MRSAFHQAIAVLAACFLLVAGAQAIDFIPLGDLPEGNFKSRANGISADGSVVVGRGDNVTGPEAFRWTLSGGMVGLGGLPDASPFNDARDVSTDGSVIVGWSNSTLGGEAFRWTLSSGMVGLGDLQGGSFGSQAFGVSADGGTVVGLSISTPGGEGEAFRWAQSAGMAGLGNIPGDSFSVAYGVSANGNVVVGQSLSISGGEAFRWTSGGGMVGLGDLAGGSFNSVANSVSADGNVVVGWGRSASGTEAFRWTSSGGMEGLGDLAGAAFISQANGISADARVVVGWGSSTLGREAFIWTSSNGMLNLREALVTNGATGLAGWTLTEATGISADGLWVAGAGINPLGQEEAWVVQLGRFIDVPLGFWAYSFIETVADSGITAGCGKNSYCPDASVTRVQMAVFLERGIHGSGFSPSAASGNVFLDVSAGSFAASFIEQFALDGITAGCGNNNYCPDGEVTRDQMAVFLLRAKHGASFSPPPASGVFNDVPLSHWAVHWIEQLAAEGITSGCGNDNYCPDAVVTRDQMAVFLVRTFGL